MKGRIFAFIETDTNVGFSEEMRIKKIFFTTTTASKYFECIILFSDIQFRVV